jgi:predicted esterase
VTDSAGTRVHTIEARTHGRVMMRQPGGAGPWPVLVGFHGYAEDAEIHLRALAGIPGSERWLLVAVQALHPFYTRQNRIVANWMTSQDRELAIGDNVDYVGRVLEWVRATCGATSPLVFAGFSQGGAMAYRAAARYGGDGILILAADVPPDVSGQPNVSLPPILIGRGVRDEWYTGEKHAADLETLSRAGAIVESCVFDGGHEWSPEFYEAAGRFLARQITTAT